MLHPVGLFEPNASSRTFKPRTLISDPATIYCRAAGAPVSMAHSTDRAIALPSWYRRADLVHYPGSRHTPPQAAAGTIRGWSVALWSRHGDTCMPTILSTWTSCDRAELLRRLRSHLTIRTRRLVSHAMGTCDLPTSRQARTPRRHSPLPCFDRCADRRRLQRRSTPDPEFNAPALHRPFGMDGRFRRPLRHRDLPERRQA